MMSELFDEQAMREQYEIAREMEIRAESEAEGMLKILVGLVKKGVLTIVQAADEASMSAAEFEALTESKKA